MFQINKKTYNFLNKEPPPKKIYLCRVLFGQFGVNKRVLYVGLVFRFDMILRICNIIYIVEHYEQVSLQFTDCKSAL